LSLSEIASRLLRERAGEFVALLEGLHLADRAHPESANPSVVSKMLPGGLGSDIR
jgi:hypothetical protein